jgi:hypothetical protein
VGTNKLKREMTRILEEEGATVLRIDISPHLKFRCRNQHGVEFMYVCGCSPSGYFYREARRDIRRLASLTTPPRSACA